MNAREIENFREKMKIRRHEKIANWAVIAVIITLIVIVGIIQAWPA
jgi:archaellum biogenesis protein FlaJ (TadC family)